MIKWLKRKQNENTPNSDASSAAKVVQPAQQRTENKEDSSEKQHFFTRFKQGLSKTRRQLAEGVSRVLLGKKEIDPSILEELETILLSADFGVETTQHILKELTEALTRQQLQNGEALLHALKNQLQVLLLPCEKKLKPQTEDKSPFVILMVGVNGAGKTTSIGKLAAQFKQEGKKVMLAAGDTFRAAAVEQLKAWGDRNQVPVIAQHSGADSASVIYDALQAAKARGIDVLLADTAGRLHTQSNLMEELKKVKRVMQKLDVHAPHETLLVLDAGIGQNALKQAQQFHQAIGLTGIMMTKLDGTAKGGILFAIANELKIPFRYVGIGEGVDDLHPFDASQFIRALFND